MGAALAERVEALKQTGPQAGTNDLVLEIPPEAEHVRTARLFAAAAARHFALDEERIEDLKVAISEACTNAINAHGATAVEDPIRVAVKPEESLIRFDVIDAGAGFNPEEALTLSPDYTPPIGLFEGSLGLALVRSLFPAMEIRRNADRGMTVSIPVER
jgi:serine/threonine-protein kinase RsbW